MKNVSALLPVIVALIVTSPAMAHRPGEHKQGTLVTPLIHWDKYVRKQVNETRADKCLSPQVRQFRYAYQIPMELRRHAIRVELERLQKARAASDRCGPAHESLWLCIHSREGSWTDPNAPYFGGLQMGYWFMSTYGGSLYRNKGTANHWTPSEQMGVAERAYAVSGFSRSWLFGQWPNTAPPCV